jgi:hypothetical protein
MNRYTFIAKIGLGIWAKLVKNRYSQISKIFEIKFLDFNCNYSQFLNLNNDI